MRRRVMKGVYKITCIPTGQVYVGSSKDIHERWKQHRMNLRHGRHRNQRMQTAFRDHGADAFVLDVLEETDPDVRVDAEQVWIGRLQPSFNITMFASPMHMAATVDRVRRNLAVWCI